MSFNGFLETSVKGAQWNPSQDLKAETITHIEEVFLGDAQT